MQDIVELKKQIIASRMLAKVTLDAGAQVEIIAIYEQSKYHYCFFTFEAKSPKAKPASWTPKGCHSIYQGKYMTLKDMVDNEIHFHFRNKMIFTDTKLFCSQQELDEHLDRIAHPPRQEPTPGAKFDIVESKSLAGQRRTSSWLGGKKRPTIRFIR